MNLKTQYGLCSDGKLQFEPLMTNPLVGTDGVYTVNLTTIVINGSDLISIYNDMVKVAKSNLGVDYLEANHVMFCIPPGTLLGNNSWETYHSEEYSSHSVYNDIWCSSPWAQLHEIGTLL